MLCMLLLPLKGYQQATYNNNHYSHSFVLHCIVDCHLVSCWVVNLDKAATMLMKLLAAWLPLLQLDLPVCPWLSCRIRAHHPAVQYYRFLLLCCDGHSFNAVIKLLAVLKLCVAVFRHVLKDVPDRALGVQHQALLPLYDTLYDRWCPFTDCICMSGHACQGVAHHSACC